MRMKTTRDGGHSDPTAPSREDEQVGTGRGTGRESARARRSAESRGSLDGCRVLVVDDDPLIRMVVRRTLGRLGCVVDTLSNGEDAVRMLEMSPFDIVLLDLELPGLGGIEVARVVRDPLSRVLDRGVPIVALTTRTGEEDRRLCAEAGMNGFVPKPIRVRDLVRAVRTQAEARGSRGG